MTLARFPLTPLQLGMVCTSRYRPRAGLNVEQWIIDFREAVDARRLRQAWEHVVAQYGALRLAIDFVDATTPCQVLHEAVETVWHESDWSAATAEEIEARHARFLADDRRRGFDLETPPLWRVELIRLGPDAWRFVCTYHHLLLDGRSLIQVGREFLAAYDAFGRGATPSCEPETPFRAFAETVAHYDHSRSAEFWRSALADRPPARLPQPHGAGHDGEFETREIVEPLARSTLDRLRRAAEAADVTLHAFVQAAWGLTLAAFTGEDDHVFGSVRACRHVPIAGAETMVGLLINTVPFRVRIDPAATLGDWLLELRRRQVSLREHELTPPTEAARFVGQSPAEPLLPTLLMFTDRGPESMFDVDGHPHATRTVQLLERSEFALSLTVDVDDHAGVRLEFDTGRYEEVAARRLVDHFLHLLEVLPEFVDRPIEALPSVAPSARRTLLDWSRSEHNPPVATTILERFEQTARRIPQQAAIAYGDRQWTFAELQQRSWAATQRLQSLGLEQGDLVGVFCERSPELIALVLGLWRCGGVYVPLDPKYPSQRLGAIVAEAAPRFIVCGTELPGDVSFAESVYLALDEVVQPGASTDRVDTQSAATLEDRAVVLFTSGSTGTPKGVVLSHRNLANHNAHVIRSLNLEPGDRLAPVSSINFDASLEEFFCTLCSGATVVLPEADTFDSLARFVDFIEHRRLTVLDLPTSLWREMTNYLYDVRRALPACVRLLFMGGEAATRSVYDRFLKVGGDRIRWINAYGPTETSIFSTAYEHTPERDAVESEAPPIGRPIDNTTVFVVDRRGRLVPPGVEGELYLGGLGVAEGYLNQPERTTEKFLDAATADLPPDRYYRTGDRVRFRHDGLLEYRGRLDDQVKLRGFRIEPAEIEAVLARHLAVRDVVVVPRTSAIGSLYLVAYVVLHDGAAWDECALRTFAEERLPEYMAPGIYCRLDQLPLTPNGKIDRRALPESFSAEPAATAARRDPASASPLERKILDVWRATLDREQLGLEDDFFTLGGDSLRAMTLIARLEEVLDRRISPALLWRTRTVARLAEELTDVFAEPTTDDPIVLRDGDRTRPLFLIHSLAGDVWIYAQLAGELRHSGAVFGIPLAGVHGAPLDDDSVEACAAASRRALQKLQPQGPYRLAGYSSGGLIAYEMARQFRAAGEEVEFLGLLDSGVPTILERRLTASVVGRGAALLRRLPELAGELAQMTFVDRWRRIGRFTANCARRLLRRRSAESHDVEWNDREIMECFAEDISFFPAQRLELIKRHYRALERYNPPALEIDAHLFRSTRQPIFAIATPTMGWDHLIQGRLDVHRVGGSHGTFMQVPCVTLLAAAMDAALAATAPEPEAVGVAVGV